MEKRFIMRWMFVELANSVKFSKLAELLSKTQGMSTGILFGSARRHFRLKMTVSTAKKLRQVEFLCNQTCFHRFHVSNMIVG